MAAAAVIGVHTNEWYFKTGVAELATFLGPLLVQIGVGNRVDIPDSGVGIDVLSGG